MSTEHVGGVRSARRHRTRFEPRIGNKPFGVLLAVPGILVLFALFLYPLGYSLYQSFRYYDLARPDRQRWVGLENYRELLTNESFHVALKNTLVYSGVAVPFEMALGLLIALCLTQIRRGEHAARLCMLLPMMLAPIALSTVWKFLYNDQLGPINIILRDAGLMERPPLWLADPNIALLSVVAVDIWATTPFVILILHAGRLGIPTDLYESAHLDGANSFAAFLHITLPLLKPALLITVLLRGMDAFRVFDIIYSLTRGGPAGNTQVLSLLAYQTAFSERSVGGAAAIAWMMTLILLVLGITVVLLNRRPGDLA